MNQTSQPQSRRLFWPLAILILAGGLTVAWTALLAWAFVDLAFWVLS
jgi:hypothetical protein